LPQSYYMVNFLRYLVKTAVFWLLFFAFYRLVFILFNWAYAAEAPLGVLAKSFLVGIRLDLSMTGYLLLLLSVVQAFLVGLGRQFSYRALQGIQVFFIIAFTTLLLGNINLYAYWGRLLDAEGFSFLKTPWIIVASVQWYESLLFLFFWIVFSWGAIAVNKGWMRPLQPSIKLTWLSSGLAAFMVLFVGALMIIPIRGSFGVAPINTGVGYFSAHNYANHAAINPLWNLFYSFKRMDARMHHYRFMEEEQAEAIYREMHSSSNDSTLRVLKSDRPNVVVILLESFSAQVVGALGGENVTPNLDALAREGLLFSNIYAASDRSDKGLVATLAGYQVLPGYSIIQYPNKSQSLNFMPQILKEAGYRHLTYIYGGDIGFKGMNSFVTLSGFDKVITIDDFPLSTRGKKWGVHDEYTFDRLLEEMAVSSSSDYPFFKYYFTLSSHEPFDVPMEQVHEDLYLNSVYYTDKCIGDFFKQVKERGLWDNTLFVLIADHGTAGPKKASSQMQERYHIPMVWTGGALAVQDSIVSHLGSQKDMVSTLLNQLSLNSDMFKFSKNLLSPGTSEYAFFTYPDAFGFVTPHSYQVYDNAAKKYVMNSGAISPLDSLRGKAMLQMVSADHLKR
jgi:phosphoglycerol transferase MdoB-like AlkP superfamily enzyme